MRTSRATCAAEPPHVALATGDGAQASGPGMALSASFSSRASCRRTKIQRARPPKTTTAKTTTAKTTPKKTTVTKTATAKNVAALPTADVAGAVGGLAVALAAAII